MYIGRIQHSGPDGLESRIVVASDMAGPWSDLRSAERRRLERNGASAVAAARIANEVAPGSLTAALESGDLFFDVANGALENDDEPISRNDLSFITPVDPPAYRDFMSFEDHFSFGYRWRGIDVPDVMYQFPVSYMGAAQSFIGPDDEVPWPHFTQHMDYELELGIVIGRRGRDIHPDDATKHIVGLTILNDFSARDIQLQEMAAGLGPSKGKHFASAIGPWIMTMDELPQEGLHMTSRVNGETWCDACSSEMIWSISEIVAWASAAELIVEGTILGSGTANGGSGVEIGKSLKPGDVVELEIERLGILRNRLGQPKSGWIPNHRNASVHQ